MKKRRDINALTVFLLLLPCLVGVGCGVGARGEAATLLRECCAAMSALNSYRVEGSMRLATEASSPLPSRNSSARRFFLDISLREEVTRLDGEARSHYVNIIREGMEESGVAKSHTIEGWTIGDDHYAYSQEEGWVREDLGIYKVQNISAHFLGPEEMQLISEKAQDIHIDGEDEQAVTILFQLGEDFFRTILEKLVLRAKEKGQPLPEAWVEEAESSLADSRAEVRFIVDKGSKLLSECRVEYSTEEIGVSLHLRPREYNADLQIALPQEAREALGLQDGASLPGSP